MIFIDKIFKYWLGLQHNAPRFETVTKNNVALKLPDSILLKKEKRRLDFKCVKTKIISFSWISLHSNRALIQHNDCWCIIYYYIRLHMCVSFTSF